MMATGLISIPVTTFSNQQPVTVAQTGEPEASSTGQSLSASVTKSRLVYDQMPDFTPVSIRACRYRYDLLGSSMDKWEVTVSLTNIGGVQGLRPDIEEAPIDIYISFDPNSLYGVNDQCEQGRLADNPAQLNEHINPYESWVVPVELSMPVAAPLQVVETSFELDYENAVKPKTQICPDQAADPSGQVMFRKVPKTISVFLNEHWQISIPGGAIQERDRTNNRADILIDNCMPFGTSGSAPVQCWHNTYIKALK
jgi:hypothetical protein